MNAQLLREVFEDPKASAQATSEIGNVSQKAILVAQCYISIANEAVEAAQQLGNAHRVRTISAQEFLRSKKRC